MDGQAVAGELAAVNCGRRMAGVRFSIATPAHDAALRQLLRDNPMAGKIALSLEREPSYFAAGDIEGSEHRTIVAIEKGRVICAGSVSARLRFINGQPMRIGYLGGLRLDASCRGRSTIIRRGYEMFRAIHERGGPPIYLTSIVSDNEPARRLLERGIRGMPTYRFVGECVTLVIAARSRSFRRVRIADHCVHGKGNGPRCGRCEYESPRGASFDVAVDLLAKSAPRYQFAPAYAGADLSSPMLCRDLHADDFVFEYNADGKAIACAALWDQRAFKQAVVRGYPPWLGRCRRVANAVAAMLGKPRLPAIGRPISLAYLSHLAMDDSSANVDPGELTRSLIRGILALAQARGIDYLTIGFDARDPRLYALREAFRPREYASRLYAVHWEDGAQLAARLDGRFLGPEIACL